MVLGSRVFTILSIRGKCCLTNLLPVTDKNQIRSSVAHKWLHRKSCKVGVYVVLTSLAMSLSEWQMSNEKDLFMPFSTFKSVADKKICKKGNQP